ncbi:MAG: hypothetical protein Q4A60_05840 [Pasteurellaceae bacterium]|nr:hypothetical protein [Pasteurellaceae bacterium]
MKNSNYIEMKQCNVFSIKFPTDNIVDVLENAVFDDETLVKIEIVNNPLVKRKVIHLENGLFFTMRTTFKKITKEVLSNKIFELKNKSEYKVQDFSEKEWESLAKEDLFNDLPYSSEYLNVYYCPEKEILFTNNKSKNSKYALNSLIDLFELIGYRSIVVSNEKLGLNTKLKSYLESNQPLFKYLNFQNEVTLRKFDNGDEEFLTCRHLDKEDGREKALSALNNGFVVQSMVMSYEQENFAINFKLDEHLKLRSIRVKDFAYNSKILNQSDFKGRKQIFLDYIQLQFNSLLKIAECTVLEFTSETKLEKFV